MRRCVTKLALVLLLLLAAPSSLAQPADAGADAGASVAAAQSEPLHLRIGKAVVFGVVASVLLIAGSTLTRGRKARRRRR